MHAPPHGSSDDHYWDALVGALKNCGVECAPGLSEPELEKLQDIYSIHFPPDLRALLRRAIPVGDKFPDWRGASEPLQSRFDGPLEGILFDVEFNAFWPNSWGSHPGEPILARQAVEQLIGAAPKLIPIHLHRYVPSEPSLSGNPVLSVHQTDIIRYADHLGDYFHKEFGAPLPSPSPDRPHRSIRFWDELVALSDELESSD